MAFYLIGSVTKQAALIAPIASAPSATAHYFVRMTDVAAPPQSYSPFIVHAPRGISRRLRHAAGSSLAGGMSLRRKFHWTRECLGIAPDRA